MSVLAMSVHASVPARPGSRLLLAAVLVVASVLSIGRPARADETVTETDRRATLALWNSVAPEDTRRTLVQVLPEHVLRLDRFVAKAPDGGSEYVISFGTAESDGSGTGFHMITIGATPSNPATRGWTLLPAEAGDEAETWIRSVDRSDRERFREVRIRGRMGALALVVSEKRSARESIDEATPPLKARYARLRESARDAGLILRVSVRRLVGSDEAGAVELTGLGSAPIVGIGSGGRDVRLRLRLVDGKGASLEPLWYTVTLGGPLAPFTKVDGATPSSHDNRYDVLAPGPEHDVTLVVSPPSSDALGKILGDVGVLSKDPTLTCLVAARQKGIGGKAGESLDGTPDAWTRVGLRIVPWLAYAAACFVVPSAEDDRPIYLVSPADRDLFMRLRVLQNDVRIRAMSVDYEADEPLFSGFAVAGGGDRAAPGSLVRGHYAVGPERALVRRTGDDVRFFAAVDVTAPIANEVLHAALKERFEVVSESLTVHRVSEDPERLRAATPPDPKLVELFSAPARPLGVLPSSAMPPRAIWHATEKGVYEFRWRAVVSGALASDDPRKSQVVEAALRIVVGERPNGFTWRDLDRYAR